MPIDAVCRFSWPIQSKTKQAEDKLRKSKCCFAIELTQRDPRNPSVEHKSYYFAADPNIFLTNLKEMQRLWSFHTTLDVAMFQGTVSMMSAVQVHMWFDDRYRHSLPCEYKDRLVRESGECNSTLLVKQRLI